MNLPSLSLPPDQLSLLTKAIQDEQSLRLARRSYPAFTERLGYVQARHHRLLSEKLEAVERGEIKRLMVFMPPGAAKSTYANILFTPWYLGRNPDRNIITASYGQELADKWGRRSRNIVASNAYASVFGLGVSEDSSAANRWATDRGGEYLAVGVGGPITGNRADGAIIDDPVKGREEAESLTIRQRQKDWYRDDLWTRLKPEAWVILIMTRWHEDDLAGWLLEEAKAGGEQWEVLSIPAAAEGNDPLGRALGELLWPEWFTDQMFAEARRDPRRWASLYQQRPAPEEGSYFQAAWLKRYLSVPPIAQMSVYGASDYAVTEGGGDWTVHIVVGVDPDGKMHVLDLWRGQTSSDQWVEKWCDMVLLWKPVEWAEESGQIKAGIGPFRDRRARERGAYVYCRTFPTRGDKAVRAQSIRGRMALDGLFLPHMPDNAAWVEPLRSELLGFPAGKHDDQVDALGLIGQLLDTITGGDRPKAPQDRYQRKARATGSAWAV